MTAAPVTRSYRGSLPKATERFQVDAIRMAASDWYPVSQTYAQGSWGCGYFLIALLLCVIIIGFLIFIAMLIVKPEGTLVVVYEYRPPAPVASPPAAMVDPMVAGPSIEPPATPPTR